MRLFCILITIFIAMITTDSYLNSSYSTLNGEGYDGVVKVTLKTNNTVYNGTGSLLYGGTAILTAAHIFAGKSGSTSIVFDTVSTDLSSTARRVDIHPDYDPTSASNDLAIVWLEEPAPVDANRYELYRSGNEIFHTFEMVGYGQVGTGNTGGIDNAENLRLVAENRFEATSETLSASSRINLSWNPQNTLFADFDNGLAANDLFGLFLGITNVGLGASEGMIASGDSGGPSFIDGLLAGVATSVIGLSSAAIDPDVDDIQNSSFGEVGAWQRVSSFQQWIDQSLRREYINAPVTSSEVKKSVSESDNVAYFMVSYSGSIEEGSYVSVSYSTRDGTAVAGQDYLATMGVLNIYDNEEFALIPVELIEDSEAEPDEVFYMDVTNPIGGAFVGGAIKLSAIRTIVDDDWIA